MLNETVDQNKVSDRIIGLICDADGEYGCRTGYDELFILLQFIDLLHNEKKIAPYDSRTHKIIALLEELFGKGLVGCIHEFDAKDVIKGFVVGEHLTLCEPRFEIEQRKDAISIKFATENDSFMFTAFKEGTE